MRAAASPSMATTISSWAGPAAHFRLPKEDPYFSRVHFMVEVNPPYCRLVDMDSTNGTRLNGQTVHSADLKDGDLIEGGNTALKVSFCEPPAISEADDTASQQIVKPLAPDRLTIQSTASWDRNAQPIKKGPANRELPTIPGYEVLRELGQGGMGVVYLCRRSADSSAVAVKTIRPAAVASELQVQCFLREASILQKLRHPHIVAFHEMGQAGDLLYFAMEYVDGTDAARMVKGSGPLTIGEAVRLSLPGPGRHSLCQCAGIRPSRHQAGQPAAQRPTRGLRLQTG